VLDAFDQAVEIPPVTRRRRRTNPDSIKHLTVHGVVVGCAAFASNSTGERLVRMVQYDSGGSAVETVSEDRDEAAGSSSVTYLTSTGLAYTDTTTDYITMQVRQNSGGNLNVNSGAQITTVHVAWLGELF